MIDTQDLQEVTFEKMQEFRDRAVQTLINNQECYVAQWVLQNPFAKMSEYMLRFYPEEGNPNVYGVRMEKIDQ